MSKSIFIILCLCVLYTIIEGRIGKRCYHRAKKIHGVCKKPLDCPSYHEDQQHKIRRQKCGKSRTLCCTETVTVELHESFLNDQPMQDDVGQKSQETKPCYHETKRKYGECKRHSDCPTVFEDAINRIDIQKCEESNTYCCATSFLENVPSNVNVGQKSKEMCKKYEDLAFTWERAPTLSVDEELEKKDKCPRAYSGTPIIYGGTLVEEGEFTHMAILGYGMEEIKWHCGGSLVSDKFVLTAAHCSYSRQNGAPKRIRLGILNISSAADSKHLQEIPIKKIHNHPMYKFPKTYNDIAILELEYPANLSVYVKPICIYTEKEIPNKVIATGWGKTENSTNKYNDVLWKVGLDIYDHIRCSASYTSKKVYPSGVINSIQMCYGSTKKKDTCFGDSGGPIQINNNDTACSYYIIGIISTGKDCGTENFPGVYVRIYPYIEWIESIIWS